MTEKKKRGKNNYLNNKDMLAELKKSKADGKMTTELTKMIMMLCKRYGQHPWFINYSYNDDMQAFALLTVVKFWNRFDETKSTNAFAYFTQIIKRAFYQFNIQEKKHRNIRDLLLIEHGENPSHSFGNDHDSDNYHFEKLDNYEKDEHYKTFDRELSKVAGDNVLTDPDKVVEVPDPEAKSDDDPKELGEDD